MNKETKALVKTLEADFDRACSLYRNAGDFADDDRIDALNKGIDACTGLIAVHHEDFNMPQVSRWINNRESKQVELEHELNGESFESYRARLVAKAKENA